MAFLPALAAAAAPAAAGTVASTAGAAALAKAATLAGTSSLASGIAAGSALGAGASMAAMPALSYAGANLAAPALSGLKAASAAPGLLQTAGMSPLGGIQSLAANAPNLAAQNQVIAEFSRQGLGQNLPQLGSKLAGPADSLAFKPVIKDAPFLNTFSEGAALPGVTSNLPGATLGNVAGGPAVPGVTSGLPVGTTQVPLAAGSTSPIESGASFLRNAGNLLKNPSMQGVKDYVEEHPFASMYGAYSLYNALSPDYEPPETSKGMIRPYKFQRTSVAKGTKPSASGEEQVYLRDEFTPLAAYEAPGPEYEEEKAASGGIMGLAVGGPVEQMSAMNALGSNMTYPQAQYQNSIYSNPMMQRPVQSDVISQGLDTPVDRYLGEPKFAEGGETKTEGGYKYSFDPKTQVFTQLSVPKAVQQGGRGGQGQGQEYTRYTGTTPLDPNKDDYYYVPGSMAGQGYFMARGVPGASAANTGPKTSGGIATPTGGLPPLATPAPTAPPAPAQPPINVPAYQSPEEQLGLTDFYTMMNKRLAQQGGYAAGGGVYDLGGYSDGGRLLRGPGDGVSDSIPAVIGNRQPARLADGEFVVPARIVSELGNGSTEAGARKLYAMMDRVQKARRKTVGKNKVAKNTRADKFLPA